MALEELARALAAISAPPDTSSAPPLCAGRLTGRQKTSAPQMIRMPPLPGRVRGHSASVLRPSAFGG